MKHFSDMPSPRSAAPLVAPPRQLVPISIRDRGPATFFHGRERELRAFQEVRTDSLRSNGGTVFLVQGAPGAGKTALLHEGARRAKADGWRVAVIKNSALYDPNALARALGLSYATKITEHQEAGWRAGLSSVAALVRRWSKGRVAEYGGLAVDDILTEAATPKGLILLLDEVQTLSKAAGTPYDLTLTQTLEQIHNGKVGAPVILMAGGLGTSEGVFGTFGVSRFIQDCLLQLGRLSPEAERAVIRDWLVQAGGARGTSDHLTRWIDTIAAECHGWPQHIQLYAPRAAKWLVEHESRLTADVPMKVMAQGHERRVKYYKGRLLGLRLDDRRAMANLLGRLGESNTLEEPDLIAAFSGHRKPEAASALFQHALHKGVVAERLDGGLSIPIPSMHAWLVQAYGNTERTLSPMSQADKTPAARRQRTVRGDKRDQELGR